MKVNINTLSPINAMSDDKQQVGATVMDMRNYYVTGGKAVPFKVNNLTFPMTPNFAGEFSEYHFSEVDLVRLLSGLYEVNKKTGKVMPVGLSLGTAAITNNGDGTFSGIPNSFKSAKFLVSADGGTASSMITRSAGSVNSAISTDAKYIIYAGSNGAYSKDSGATWTANSLTFIDVAMNPDGSIWWGITASGVYSSVNYGSTWTLLSSIVFTGINYSNGNAIATGDNGSYIYTSTSLYGSSNFPSTKSFSMGGYLNVGYGDYYDASYVSEISVEPYGASEFAIKIGSKWIKNDGTEIVSPGGDIVSVSVTKNVIITSLGTYKNNILISSYQLSFAGDFLYRTGAGVVYYYSSSGTLLRQSNYVYIVASIDSDLIILIDGLYVNSLDKDGVKALPNKLKTSENIYPYSSSVFYLNGVYSSTTYITTYTLYLGVPGNTTRAALWSIDSAARSAYGNLVMTNGTVVYLKYAILISGSRLSFGNPYFAVCLFSSLRFMNSHSGFVACPSASSCYYNGNFYYKYNNAIYRMSSGGIEKIYTDVSSFEWIVADGVIVTSSAAGVYKIGIDLIQSYVGSYPVSKLSGHNAFAGLSSTGVFIISKAAAMGSKIWDVSISGTSVTINASNGNTLSTGTYYFLLGIDGEMTPIVDPSTYKQEILIRNTQGVVFVKRIGELAEPFFETAVFSNVPAFMTYLPAMLCYFGARLVLAGGYELKTSDIITNGSFDSSLSGWGASNATWGSGYGQTGGGVLIAAGTIVQQLSHEGIVVCLCKGDMKALEAAGATIIPYSGEWCYAILGVCKTISIASAGNLYVDSVHAFLFIDASSQVSISDITNYEEFFSGTGAQIKVPSRDNVITGIVPMGKTLLVIKDDTTGKIDETGDSNNPYYVTEEYIKEGGGYPFLLGSTPAVVRKNQTTGYAEIYVMSGDGYSKVNLMWNTGIGDDRGMTYGKISPAWIGSLLILNYRKEYCPIVEDGDKIGVAQFSGIGVVYGDMSDGMYSALDSGSSITVYSQAAEADQMKRIRSVQVLPPQDVVIAVGDGTTTVSASSATGMIGCNMAGSEFFVTLDLDGTVSQIVLDIDKTMPRNRR